VERLARPDRLQPKDWIRAIHAYVPGKSAGLDGQPLIKLSANENPLGTSGAAVEARAQVANTALYPDPDSKDLRAALAALHGLDPARIVMGTGSDELLHRRPGLCRVGDEVLFVRYGLVYPIAARRCGATRWKRPTAITAPMSTRCSPP
jgi:histidinol-phosphate aminotransferase